MKSEVQSSVERNCEICEVIAKMQLPARTHAMFTCAKQTNGETARNSGLGCIIVSSHRLVDGEVFRGGCQDQENCFA
jgi:hypothetical protein